MKKFIFIGFLFLSQVAAVAQTNPEQFIEGGKTLIELIKLIKTPKKNGGPAAGLVRGDSCVSKQTADLCFRNQTNRSLSIIVFKKTEGIYESLPFTLKIPTGREECWFEMKAGIYKYKIEEDLNGQFILYREGELKLNACDQMQRTITE